MEKIPMRKTAIAGQVRSFLSGRCGPVDTVRRKQYYHLCLNLFDVASPRRNISKALDEFDSAVAESLPDMKYAGSSAAIDAAMAALAVEDPDPSLWMTMAKNLLLERMIEILRHPKLDAAHAVKCVELLRNLPSALKLTENDLRTITIGSRNSGRPHSPATWICLAALWRHHNYGDLIDQLQALAAFAGTEILVCDLLEAFEKTDSFRGLVTVRLSSEAVKFMSAKLKLQSPYEIKVDAIKWDDLTNALLKQTLTPKDDASKLDPRTRWFRLTIGEFLFKELTERLSAQLAQDKSAPDDKAVALTNAAAERRFFSDGTFSALVDALLQALDKTPQFAAACVGIAQTLCGLLPSDNRRRARAERMGKYKAVQAKSHHYLAAILLNLLHPVSETVDGKRRLKRSIADLLQKDAIESDQSTQPNTIQANAQICHSVMSTF